MSLGISLVHPGQVTGPQRGLVSSGGGANLDDDVFVVIRILRHEQQLQLGLQLLRFSVLSLHLLTQVGQHLLVGFALRQFPRFAGLGLSLLPRVVSIDDRLQIGVALGGLGIPGLVRGNLRIGHFGQRLIERSLDLGQFGDQLLITHDIALHAASQMGPRDRTSTRSSSESAYSRLATATSTWSSSGSLVVSRCSSIPGRDRKRR